ncbi:cell division topological specificity factor MinE [Photobacterium aphoticum]|uniref:Cell division topological specificity factor n=1 Tax=Photobacterium aphoticum TaxID=754436 RepID=A0A090QQG3_9GAMM|nr:cell division topological specificity factor MinE [Photobacterium aphoticum]KLV00084.1 cell division topological specificity factor MinE [Photobacterium aphoticum]PSU55891.1 cell division topological specificity factor MinE [Photobacterium aphoticum]GAL05405.1 cell division topological specificity factor MinE [Photobacterium aphoticum]GHA48622.1 cell division topological specificity factor [Photobacterium aphoticum]
MALLEFFRPKKTTTASVAKERLQIIVAERRSAGQGAPSYLPQLKQDILEVISKYVAISPDQVTVHLDQKEEDLAVLELNVTLPEEDK